MPNLLPGLGDTVGPYRLLRILGSGGQGTVYQAERSGADGLATQLAIKLMPPLPEDEQSGERRYRAFLHEAYLLTLMHHPHIVTVFEVTRISGFPAIVMEYVEGTSLDRVIADHRVRREPISVAFALRVAIQAARALSYAQGLKDRAGKALEVIHRDIKPANVLLGPDGSVKLTDFGLAHSLSEEREHTEVGVLKGTVKYMSPEQAVCDPLGHQTDVFSLGVVLYECVTLSSPFGLAHDAGTSRFLLALQTGSRELEARVDAVRQWCEPVGEILGGMLAWDPQRRFPDARALLPELERAARLVEEGVMGQVPPSVDATLTGDDATGEWSSRPISRTWELSGNDLPSAVSGPSPVGGATPVAPPSASRATMAVEAAPSEPSLHAGGEVARPPVNRQGRWRVAAVVVAAVAVVVAAYAVGRLPAEVETTAKPMAAAALATLAPTPGEPLESAKPPAPDRMAARPVATPTQLRAPPPRSAVTRPERRIARQIGGPGQAGPPEPPVAPPLPADVRFMGMPSVLLTVAGQERGEASLIGPIDLSLPAGTMSMVARDVHTGEVVFRHAAKIQSGAHYRCHWDGGSQWTWEEGRAMIQSLSCDRLGGSGE